MILFSQRIDGYVPAADHDDLCPDYAKRLGLDKRVADGGRVHICTRIWPDSPTRSWFDAMTTPASPGDTLAVYHTDDAVAIDGLYLEGTLIRKSFRKMRANEAYEVSDAEWERLLDVSKAPDATLYLVPDTVEAAYAASFKEVAKTTLASDGAASFKEVAKTTPASDGARTVSEWASDLMSGMDDPEGVDVLVADSFRCFDNLIEYLMYKKCIYEESHGRMDEHDGDDGTMRKVSLSPDESYTAFVSSPLFLVIWQLAMQAWHPDVATRITIPVNSPEIATAIYQSDFYADLCRHTWACQGTGRTSHDDWQRMRRDFDYEVDSELRNLIRRRYTHAMANKPCICGSGKKFKKCCGSPTLTLDGFMLPKDPMRG